MKRRKFMGILALAGTVLAAGRALAAKITSGRCGAKCSRCEKQKSGKCDGCGTGEKAQCIVFRCNSRKGLESCAYCKANPCAKHKRIAPPESALS